MINLTHYDLDGIVSHILLRQVIPNLQFVATGYQKLEETLDELLERNEPLIISDLSLDERLAKKLDNHNKKILYIDHHLNSKKLKFDNNKITFFHNEKRCAAANIFTYFHKKGFKFSSKLKQLTYLTNDYDLWQHKETESKLLNYIFWKEQADYFIKLFSQGYDKKVVHRYQFEYQKTIKDGMHFLKNECERQKIEFDGINAFLIFTPMHIDLVMDTFPDYDIYFIVAADDKISVRLSEKFPEEFNKSLESIMDTLKCRDEVDNFGYHQKAGGLVIKKEYKMDDCLLDIIEVMLNEAVIPF